VKALEEARVVGGAKIFPNEMGGSTSTFTHSSQTSIEVTGTPGGTTANVYMEEPHFKILQKELREILQDRPKGPIVVTWKPGDNNSTTQLFHTNKAMKDKPDKWLMDLFTEWKAAGAPKGTLMVNVVTSIEKTTSCCGSNEE